jgi:hypothetical protein
MFRFAIIVLALCGFVSSATAAPDFAGCFEREYDAAHLKAHKLQEITRMRLVVGTDLSGTIAAGFRESPDYQSSSVQCVRRGEKLSCDILGGGGSFTVALTKKGMLITNTSQMRFGPEETGISFQREGEHLKFLLQPATCQ